MINPQTLDLASLPSVALEKKNKLPRTCGIYIVLKNENEVQYIGKSIDINRRWLQHHRYKEFKKIGNIKIAYLTFNDPKLLKDIESDLISWFKPCLNNTIINSLSLREKLNKTRIIKNNHLLEDYVIKKTPKRKEKLKNKKVKFANSSKLHKERPRNKEGKFAAFSTLGDRKFGVTLEREYQNKLLKLAEKEKISPTRLLRMLAQESLEKK